MYKSKIDEEIEKREKEKFEVLEKQVEDAQNNFNDAEKNEFDNLWKFYCTNLEGIEYREMLITQIRNEEKTLEKELIKKIYVIVLSAIMICIADYFISTDRNSSTFAIFGLAICFVYLKIQNDIKVSGKNIEEKIYDNAISEIRHTLSLNSMFNIKYEREYLEAFNKLHGGSTEKEKENYEKYTNLHFTHVSDELIKLTKKKFGVINGN